MAKNFHVAHLFDFYGPLLTEKQNEFLQHYYNEDLSLSEIAENEGISRQGVRDAIKRAERQLFDMEARLLLAARFGDMQEDLRDITLCAETIHQENLRCGLSREINEAAAQIRAITERLSQ